MIPILSGSQSVQLDDSIENYPILRVTNSHCTAAIALHGAHLFEFTPNEQKPLVYLSPTAVFTKGKSIRGGIPVCWPWFSGHPTDRSLPAHGFARSQFWTLEAATDIEGGSTRLRFGLRESEDSLKLFPHPFELTLEFDLGATLKLSLRSKNTGNESFTISQALHTYFKISEISRISVRGLEGCRFKDATRGLAEDIQSDPILFDRWINRVYLDTPSELELVDHGWDRTIGITTRSCRSTVVWNSWIEQSKGFSDMPDDGYHEFACVETGHVATDQRTVEPGKTELLDVEYSIR